MCLCNLTTSIMLKPPERFIFRLHVLVPLLLIIFPSTVYSQVITIKDSISHEVIPYAIIKSNDMSRGYYTDENGVLTSIELKNWYTSNGAIVVGAIGYNNKTIPYDSINFSKDFNIILTPKTLYATDSLIEIKAKKLQSERFKFKSIDSKPIRSIENNPSAESVAQYVKLPQYLFTESEYVVVDEISIHLQTILRDNRSGFRLVVYEFKDSCSCPGNPIHSTLLVRKKAKFGWNRIKTETPIILLSNRFFVGFEVLRKYKIGDIQGGHTLSYARGGFPTYQLNFNEDSWTEPRIFKNKDLYIKIHGRMMY